MNSSTQQTQMALPIPYHGYYKIKSSYMISEIIVYDSPPTQRLGTAKTGTRQRFYIDK